MANPERGEAMIIVDGRPQRLRLTLGALAQMEASLGVSGFAALAQRLKQLSAADLALVVEALLAAGEGDGAPDPRRAVLDPLAAAQTVAQLFADAMDAKR